MKGKKLIEVMALAAVGIAFTTAGCSATKSEDELNSENEIRKLLQYDADININKEYVDNYGFKLEKSAKPGEYLLTFKTSKYYSAGRTAILKDYDEITYSVDKDFYYFFSENYNTVESKKEVDLVTELTMTYNPIKVVEAGKEIEKNSNLGYNL